MTAARPKRTIGDAASGGRRIIRRSDLEARGFRGFLPVSGLGGKDIEKVNPEPGVYAVLRYESGKPTFLSRSQGGHFKGQDPTVEADTLKRSWVEGTQVLYFGKTNELRRRIAQLCHFGAGEPVGHRGGRYLWQIADSDKFMIAWLPASDAIREHRTLMEEFRAAFGSWPFANIQGPQKSTP